MLIVSRNSHLEMPLVSISDLQPVISWTYHNITEQIWTSGFLHCRSKGLEPFIRPSSWSNAQLWLLWISIENVPVHNAPEHVTQYRCFLHNALYRLTIIIIVIIIIIVNAPILDLLVYSHLRHFDRIPACYGVLSMSWPRLEQCTIRHPVSSNTSDIIHHDTLWYGR